MSDGMSGKVDVTVSPITPEDLREAMVGSAHSGPATPEEAWGITSQPIGTSPFDQKSPAELEIEAQRALVRATSPELLGSQPSAGLPAETLKTIQEELDKFKGLYGQSENEKGELRRAMQEQMDAFNALMGQFQTLRAQALQPAYPAAQATQNPYGPVYGYPQQPAYDPLAGISDDGFLEGKDFKKIMETAIAPLAAASWQESQKAQASVRALEARLIEQTKIAAGITPVDEFRFQRENPWLNGLPPANQIEAMKGLKKAEDAAKQWRTPAATPSAQPQQQQVPGSRVVQAISHVESAPSQAAELTQDALAAAQARDLSIVLSKPVETGERARAYREFARKYNLPFGQGSANLVSR